MFAMLVEASKKGISPRIPAAPLAASPGLSFI